MHLTCSRSPPLLLQLFLYSHSDVDIFVVLAEEIRSSVWGWLPPYGLIDFSITLTSMEVTSPLWLQHCSLVFLCPSLQLTPSLIGRLVVRGLKTSIRLKSYRVGRYGCKIGFLLIACFQECAVWGIF